MDVKYFRQEHINIMVVSGNYNANNELVSSSSGMEGFDMDFLIFIRPFSGNILKTVEELSNSTFVKRIIIPDESFPRVLIGKFEIAD